MPLYVVLCEDHQRNVCVVGNEQGGPFQSKEQAENIVNVMKTEFPLREFQALEIFGLRMNDPILNVEKPKIKII